MALSFLRNRRVRIPGRLLYIENNDNNKKALKVTVLRIASSLFSLKGLYSSTALWVLESEQ